MLTRQNEISKEKFLSSFSAIKVEVIKEKKILHVQLNRPKQLNALNEVIFEDLYKLFSNLDIIMQTEDIRVAILSGNGKAFSSGLDLSSKIPQEIIEMKNNTEMDIGRKNYYMYHGIRRLQDGLSALEKCPIPIISAIHGYCLGGALSILVCTDVKIATRDSKFSIKEIDIGITADIGVIQRLVEQVGKEGMLKKYSYTGEIFNGEDALKFGLIEELVDTQEQLMERAFALASKIAEKSPLILWGLKRTINFSRDHSVQTSLDLVSTMNSSLLFTEDLPISVQSFFTKTKPMYPKL